MRKTLPGIFISFLLAASVLYGLPSGIISGDGYFPRVEPGKFIVIEDSFENGFGKWVPLGGGAKLDFDEHVSRTGRVSLKITGRVETWNGPSLPVQLDRNEKYYFEAWVYHEDEAEHPIRWIYKYTSAEGKPEYLMIAEVNAVPDTWERLYGELVIPSDASESVLYFETPDSTDLEFNLDAMTITGNKPSETTERDEDAPAEFTYGFESGTEEWRARSNSCTVECSSNFSYLGKYSLYTSDRDIYWNSPELDISEMVKTGQPYEYSAYVMYNGKSYENEHKFELLVQYSANGEVHYANVDTGTIQKGSWSRLCGECSLPSEASDIRLCIQTESVPEGVQADDNDTMAFYIDNVKILDVTVLKQNRTTRTVLTALIAAFALTGLSLIGVILYKKMGASSLELTSASTDSMTNTLNRNSYEIQMAHLENRPDECRRMWITVCDVNFLKHINDNYGHQKGDDAIIRCADVLNSVIRKKGLIFRTGGDEFVCFTKTNVSEKLRAAFDVEAQNYKGYPFSVAVGSAAYSDIEDGPVPDIKLILTRSDKEMYKNKEIQKKNMQNMM